MKVDHCYKVHTDILSMNNHTRNHMQIKHTRTQKALAAGHVSGATEAAGGGGGALHCHTPNTHTQQNDRYLAAGLHQYATKKIC